MAKELFFVESIYILQDGNMSVVCLQPTENKEQFIVQQFGQEQMRMHDHQGTIKEGWYVYYDNETQEPFGYGNLSQYARERFREYYELRDVLINRYISPDNEIALIPQGFSSNNVNVVSYHVNVGHGNCSIVLVEAGFCYQIWMVDCSTTDKTDHNRNYQANIESAFKAILKRLGRREDEQLHIDRFFLTHIHHDHYNGIDYLVNNHYIDNRTICYLNLYYQMASSTFNNALMALKNANARFVEPVSANSTNAIRFLHPECRIYRSVPTVKKTAGAIKNYRTVSSPVNNSSVVVRFELGGKAMVFPGDLEQSGFNHMSCSATCSPYLAKSDYYIVSHHGSVNGHPTMSCKNPRRPKPTPLDCVSNLTKKAFIMGRDGAYPGIYSPMVVGYWSGMPNVLEYTEHAPHYLEFDWGSGKVTRN
jgi:hypothetical protein